LLVLLLVKRRGLGFGVFLSGVTTGLLATLGSLFLHAGSSPAFRQGRLNAWDLLWIIFPSFYFGFGVGSLLASMVGIPIDLFFLLASLVSRVAKRILR
jgi:hypothetical protein